MVNNLVSQMISIKVHWSWRDFFQFVYPATKEIVAGLLYVANMLHIQVFSGLKNIPESYHPSSQTSSNTKSDIPVIRDQPVERLFPNGSLAVRVSTIIHTLFCSNTVLAAHTFMVMHLDSAYYRSYMLAMLLFAQSG